jgi:SPP1 gp7 family putative phage head morphogenesis protein
MPQLRKRTNAYWEKRSLERLTAAERVSNTHLKQINKVYDEARRQTVQSVKSLYANYYKGDDGFDMAALKAIAPSGDIKRFRDEMKLLGLDTYLPERYAGRMTRLELLNAQMWGETKKVGLKQNQIQSKSHVATINSAYNHNIYDTAKGLGATPAFSQLNTRTVNKILNAKFEGENYSQRIWNNTDVLAKQLQGKLGAAIASGQAQPKTVREIQERFGVSKYYAKRLVQTETNYFENSAEIESLQSMDIEKFVFVATLDGRTSVICQYHDGRIYNVADAIMGYNVPPLHPNCRSTIRAYFGREWEPEMRIARDPRTGRNQYVYNQSYDFWAKNNGIKNVSATIVPSFLPRGNNGVQWRLGDQHYEAMNTLVDAAPQLDQDIWNAYVDQLKIDNPMYGGGAHFSPRTKGVSLNIKKDAAGSAFGAPYQTAFHELFHNIDYLAGEKLGDTRSFSYIFKNNIFGKTLKTEAEKQIEKYMKQKTVEGIMTRSKAVKLLSADLNKIKKIDRAALSDIFHGATGGAVHAGFGHSSVGYWRRTGALNKEAFANMASVNIANPGAAKLIKKYFPESVKIYDEMLAEILKGAKK